MDRSIEFEDNPTYELAVEIKNVCKSYDKKVPPVLNKFCMNVKKGSIYSLLGSSGCGKTTVLSCILGITKWESGEIKMFGENPGPSGKENFVNRVGYVPQEIALYEQLTIKENIRYYGALYGIPENVVFEQWMLLKKLLMLPSGSKWVSRLSGGQRRRVSLALSFVHQPELLILDEPTVGLDPLLRERVWEYLFTLARDKGTSIIITTHYMEETKKSDKIGVMRQGSLLVEDSPAKLLAKYNTEFLEKIILALIHKQNSKNSLSVTQGSHSGISDIQNNVCNKSHLPAHILKQNLCFLRKTLATSILISLTLIRHPIFFLAILLLPAYQVLLLFGCIGREPKGLSIAVVNEEVPDWQTKCFVDVPPTQIFDNLQGYMFTDFSCWYLQQLESHDIIKMVSSNNTIEATNGVQTGDYWGYIHFPANFSLHSVDRFIAKQFATEESINGSTIGVRLDMSVYLGSSMIIKHLYEQLHEYGNHLANHFNVSPLLVELPLNFRKPVYGSERDGYYDYYVPGNLAIIFFFLPSSCAALLFIGELKTGTYRRAQVAGRTIGEIITAHVLSQVLSIFVQIVICTLCMRFAYDYHIFGSSILYLFVGLVIGICGTTMGLVIGVVVQDEFETLMVTLFFIMTAYVSGGVVWPLACAQPIWRYIGNALPITFIIESFRSVMVRGIGITHEMVWPGIAFELGWTVVFCILVVILSKRLIN